MKKTIFAILAAASLLSCVKENSGSNPDPEPDPKPVPTEKIVIPSDVDTSPFAQYGGTNIEIPFFAYGNWVVTVQGADSWVTVTPKSGKSDFVTLTIKVGKNGTSKERKATVQIKCGDEVRVITVTQGGNPDVPVESVKLESSVSVRMGSTLVLKATVLPEDAKDKTVSWKSDRPDLVVVQQDGTLVPVAEGETFVTATCGGKSASCTVKVLPKPEPQITFDSSSKTLKIGATMQINISVYPDDIPLKYVSLNSKVASVDADGVVTAIAAGTAIITISTAETEKYAPASVSFSLTVNPDLKPGFGHDDWNEGSETEGQI